ncbi:MAG TPA: histidine kinase [Candidatus Acidoferrales bacterium]|nr:histidine kinase [Candidatus Acidoferrales bacterium]
MTLLASTKEILFTQMMRVAAAASLAALVARFAVFRRLVFAEHRRPRQNVELVLMLALPLALGVVFRLFGYHFADLSLEGALLIGLVGGRAAGPLGGVILSLPALAHGEWLAMPVAVTAGLVGGLIRDMAPDREAVWNFGPFTFLSVPRRAWRLLVAREPAWQLAPLGACVLLELGRLALGQAVSPRWLFYFPANGAWMTALDVFAAVFAVSLPIKIWGSIRLELNLEENQRLLLKARMDALTSQINPHFLFNTLNTVSSLVRYDPDRAREVVLKLSNILRRLLRQHETFVPLRDELEFIDNYLDIEVARFGRDKLQFFKEVEEETLEAFVPSMLLQPIVENAIKHGLAPQLEGGEIRLRTRRRDGRLTIEVEDNGAGIPQHRRPEVYDGGIGFRNVRERLRLIYGDDFRLDIASGPGQGTLICIDIPEPISAVPPTRQPA